ncbi:hypothetical protein JCGZ_06920 [Jatropha curcas]|uniref:Uncharacterized protein n=1 Tax=Jatropha curcas TaxID=180498 RepID=A0A067KYY9_JATCU|nr:hypothetical protein JCGZ_06920 [Jatropha curcas]
MRRKMPLETKGIDLDLSGEIDTGEGIEDGRACLLCLNGSLFKLMAFVPLFASLEALAIIHYGKPPQTLLF